MNPENRSPLKDPPLRLPGQSSTMRHNDLREDRIVIPILAACTFVCIAMYEWLHYFGLLPLHPWVSTLIAIGAIAYAAWNILRVRPELDRLRQGLYGERAVGQFLESYLARGYKVFHDVLGDGFNVDHVIIGPAGIFTVETKTWSKPRKGNAQIVFQGEELTIDGRPPNRDPIIQARAQARWLEKLLSESTAQQFAVRPVIVFPGWYIDRKVTAAKDLWVLEPKALPSFLDHEPGRLRPDQVALASFHLSRFVRAGERHRLQDK